MGSVKRRLLLVNKPALALVKHQECWYQGSINKKNLNKYIKINIKLKYIKINILTLVRDKKAVSFMYAKMSAPAQFHIGVPRDYITSILQYLRAVCCKDRLRSAR